MAEYFVDEVRNALLIEQVPEGPVDRFLLPGPSLPVSGGGSDGTASFDGETVRLTWNWKAEESKTAGGPVSFPLSRIAGVRWLPSMGLENGSLRFEPVEGPVSAPPKYDTYSLELWGMSKKEYTAVLVAAAVLARLPQARTAVDAPTGPPALTKAPAPAPAAVPPADDHDVLLRRLRELGELHRAGVLTDDEFSTAKQAILSRM